MNNLYPIYEYRSDKKKKFNLKNKKDLSIKSLKDVEHFLRSIDKIAKCGKLYKILR